MTANVVCFVVAAVCFVVALFVSLFGTLDADVAQALLFGGLAAFALGHTPWRG